MTTKIKFLTSSGKREKGFAPKHFLFYTEGEGGRYKVIKNFSPARFKKLVERGYLYLKDIHKEIETNEKIYPAFAVLTKTEEHWDFILEKTRHSAEFL